MDVYIYKAALYCSDCVEEIKEDLKATCPVDTQDIEQGLFDTDDYPAGPYPDSGGEADSPQHCDGCGLFLKNSLTTDGNDYVLEALQELQEPTEYTNWAVLQEWSDYYNYLTV
jgi:hypothetical protein|tara:strand:+ start:22 stop:360 length:339 start_codon:yes stop_codon:yes gene_type:complete